MACSNSLFTLRAPLLLLRSGNLSVFSIFTNPTVVRSIYRFLPAPPLCTSLFVIVDSLKVTQLSYYCLLQNLRLPWEIVGVKSYGKSLALLAICVCWWVCFRRFLITAVRKRLRCKSTTNSISTSYTGFTNQRLRRNELDSDHTYTYMAICILIY